MADLDWLPNLFIAGVPKAGTSSLHRWLADHPDAVGARDKEACFFVDRDSHIFDPRSNAADGFEGYRRQFAIASGQRPRVILDSTPAYIYQRTALDLIPDLPSRPRCVFVLREPSDQIRSVYTYYRNNWMVIPAKMGFDTYIDAVRAGDREFQSNELVREALTNARYIDHLLPWRARLGAERILVCTFDDLVRDPRALTRRIATWSGLDPAFYDTYSFATENETYAPRSRGLHRLGQIVRERLPAGAGYDALRATYRRINTRRPARIEHDQTTQTLRADYADANNRLAREFDLDLSAWGA